MPNTNGFRSPLELLLHFADHGPEFGAMNVAEYETLADGFWKNPKPINVRECTRSSGDVLRLDMMTDAYSVLSRTGVVRTFFKPVPCASVPSGQRDAERKSGRCHAEPNNLQYFQKECRK